GRKECQRPGCPLLPRHAARGVGHSLLPRPARGSDTGKQPTSQYRLAIADDARFRLRTGPALHRSPSDPGSSRSRVRRRLGSTARGSPAEKTTRFYLGSAPKCRSIRKPGKSAEVTPSETSAA